MYVSLTRHKTPNVYDVYVIISISEISLYRFPFYRFSLYIIYYTTESPFHGYVYFFTLYNKRDISSFTLLATTRPIIIAAIHLPRVFPRV